MKHILEDKKQRTFPEEWEPTNVHIKSGWKNNPEILYEITSFVNDEEFIEDESDFAEKLDYVLEFFKQKYIIQPK